MKNKKSRIILDLILIILGIIFLVFGIKDAIEMFKSTNTKIEDAVLFKKDYSYAPNDNVYEYLTLEDADEMLESGTGIMLISSPTDAWTQVLVEPLDYIVKYEKETIHYQENKKLDESSKHYKSILSKLDTDMLSNPTIIFIKNGTINKIYLKEDIYDVDYEGAPVDYWNDELRRKFNENIHSDIESLN